MYPERRRRLAEAVAEANSVGVLAMVRSYTISLSELILRVEDAQGTPLDLHLRSVEEAAFRPRWRQILLEVVYGDGYLTLSDSSAGFSVRCQVIFVDLERADDDTDDDGEPGC